MTINAGVQVSVQKINITISDVEAQLELIVRLGHLVDIVQRVFESLDLNPLLITALNDVTSIVSPHSQFLFFPPSLAVKRSTRIDRRRRRGSKFEREIS